MPNEADTCRRYVLPKLYKAGWTDEQIREQVSFTDGRITVVAGEPRRRGQKRADYVLRFRRDVPLAVVEAKATYRAPGDGLQQAKGYAETLGFSFAYSTNGHGIVEHDFLTGQETRRDTFPGPGELWSRLHGKDELSESVIDRLLTPYHRSPGRSARYYQEIGINRAVQAILSGQRRVLLTMATGTGKTLVSFQVCWRLWSARWNRSGEPRRPRILFLADRNILVDDPQAKDFAPFGDARHKIEGEAVKSREMYFATYQAIARDDRRPGLFREYDPGFFDLIVVDECHRGSARDDSNWREILDYFEPAYKLGMTATPMREDNRDTYAYFGNPAYLYSLRQGIEDGFLAPYRVHRVVTEIDATGYRPRRGEKDLRGRFVPDQNYGTPDFERLLSHAGRTSAIARHLTDYLRKSGRYDKTIVFCVDQEHAEQMRFELSNLNADLVRDRADYVCRVVSDEGAVGRGHLSRFQELETTTPAILTTSQLLTTGVDAPMVKNIVIARVVNSMTEFKQMIGRGTRVQADYGKFFFTILDYTGSATQLFADPGFDGEPALITQEEMDEKGAVVSSSTQEPEPLVEMVAEPGGAVTAVALSPEPNDPENTKYYVDGGWVKIAANLVYELDSEGRQLRVVQLTDYTREKVRSLFSSAAELRRRWANAEQRTAVLEALTERGVDLERLREATGQPEADAFDLLCNVVYSSPLRTRRERADRLRKEHREFFERFTPEARVILDQILDKYADHGLTQLTDAGVFQVPPLSKHGSVLEIAHRFGGPEALARALEDLQELLYVA